MKIIFANISRFLLAVTFLFSGFVKANDPYGMSYKIADYFTAFGVEFIPGRQDLICAVLLAVFEFCLGVRLLFGLGKRLTSLVTLIFVAAMTLLTVYIYVENPVTDCGCFGDVIVLTNGQTLLKNIVLLFLAVMLCLWSKHIIQFVPGFVGGIVRFAGFVVITAFALHCIFRLPMIDFRPYKVGTNMNERIEIPMEGAEGVKASRYDAAGLYVMDNESGDDVTEQIFTDEKAFLVVAPDLVRASESYAGELNRLYDYSKMHGYTFYFVTASEDDAQSVWRKKTASEYPIYVSEDRILKTIIRSNPGLVIIEKGVITAKYGNWDLGKGIKSFINKSEIRN